MVSHFPPFNKTASSSSRRTLQTTPQDSNHRAGTLPPESQDESAGLDEGEKARGTPRETIQDPVSERHGGQSSGRVSQRLSRKTAALPEPPSSMSADPQLFDLSKPQRGQVRTQVYSYLGGAGQSRTNSQSTLGDGDTSGRDVSSGKKSREPSVRNSNKGRSRPGVRPNDLESRMPLVFILATPYLTRLAVPNIANATREGYHPNRPGPKSFRASLHFTLGSGHSA